MRTLGIWYIIGYLVWELIIFFLKLDSYTETITLAALTFPGHFPGTPFRLGWPASPRGFASVPWCEIYTKITGPVDTPHAQLVSSLARHGLQAKQTPRSMGWPIKMIAARSDIFWIILLLVTGLLRLRHLGRMEHNGLKWICQVRVD